MTPERMQKIKQVAGNRQQGLVVVLEDLYDPHNAMAVFRSCDAFGVQDVHLIFDQQLPFDPKAFGKQSSSSANKWLDFYSYESTEGCLEKLKAEGYVLVGTALNPRSVSIFDADLSDEKLALVIGNEKRGLSDLAIKMADRLVQIPMLGMVQSLNLSVTAAICLFEICRQRQDSETDFRIGDSQQQDLIQSFVSR